MAKFIKLACKYGNIYVPETSIIQLMESPTTGDFVVVLDKKIAIMTEDKNVKQESIITIPKENSSCLDKLLK